MPSFVAPCPRGHMGSFVTYWGYHVCHCGLHIPEFQVPVPSEDEQQRLNDLYITEGIDVRVHDAIDARTEELESDYQDKVDIVDSQRIKFDPEYYGL